MTVGVVRARSNQTPQRRGPAGLHHRLRPAVFGAVAGLAVPGGRRRAADPPDRRRRPPRHRHVEPDRLPGLTPTARPCAIRRNSRPATTRSPISPTSPTPPPPTAPTPSRRATCAYDNAHAASDIERLRTPVGRARRRAGRDRQRRPGGAGLRRVAPRQGRPADTRLPDCLGRQRRSRRRATGQGPAGRARRVRRAVRRGELRAGSRSRRAPSARCWPTPAPARDPAARRSPQLANAITVALGFPSGGRVSATTSLANALADRPLRRHQPADQPDQPRRCHPGLRRPVRQLLQRRDQPPDPGPGARTGRRVGQALPAVRHGRRAQLGQMRALAHGLAAGAAEDLKVDVLLLGVQNDPIVGYRRGRRRPRPRSSTPTRPASG